MNIPWLLCFLTSKWVLRLPFVSGNQQLFEAKTTLYVLFSNKIYKIAQKITKKHVIKGVYQRLGVTLKPKSWSTPGKNVIFHFSIKKDFDQQTACGEPVCWWKYTKHGNSALLSVVHMKQQFSHQVTP